ncbi:MAG: glycosyltransferase [Rhabdochlamydiaceae bacterium]|nr:glycosyltransferase [Rhabdochlamydiaceae bacterium]
MKQLLCFLSVMLFCSAGFSEHPSSKKTICLNMIVKNESPVIQRCLASVKPFIDYWVIVDTGSTDDTKKIIQDFMKDVPGVLHERPWVNFGHNRDEALKLAKGKGDYVLFIDADEMLTYSSLPDKSGLTLDAYVAAIITSSTFTSQRTFLINNHLNWAWKGVLHEQLQLDRDMVFEVLSGVEIRADTSDGNRAQDPQKYLKDAAVLEKALIEEPNNANYVYYLAQSYYNAGECEKSLQNYLKRAEMEGWDQHTFWAMRMAAGLLEILQKPTEQIIAAYCRAYQFRPSRAEPLYYLAKHLNSKGKHTLSYALLKQLSPVSISTDAVYVEPLVYSCGISFELAVAALGLGKQDEAKDLFHQILNNENIPDSIQETVRFKLSQVDQMRGILRPSGRGQERGRRSRLIISLAFAELQCIGG